VPDVHVIGDATDAASGMPKSAHMANAQAKVCAAAVVSLLNGEAPNPEPLLTNTCYSFVSADRAAHVGNVYRWHAERSSVVPVAGAGGVSPDATELEAGHAWGWARAIWADTLAGPAARTST
jgi:sulfide dehydrogenase [flavocytochrome c] flavoprotein chain